jgi:AraC-like DNA-binding protein
MVHSPLYRDFASAYEQATGLSLAAVLAAAWRNGHPVGGDSKLEFCQRLRRLSPGRECCEEFRRRLREQAASAKGPCWATCPFGLVRVAVPVFDGGEQVATLLAGPAWRGARGWRGWQRAARFLAGAEPAERELLRRAYGAVPAVDGRHLGGACRLLGIFVRSLEEHLPSWQLAASCLVPPTVTKAQEYMRAHAEEAVRLAEVARYAGLGVQRLCTVFRAATGLTPTHFLARLRVEKAKALLPDRSRRIAEIAFQCGFGSIPTFNRTFKGVVRLAPTEYRRLLGEAKI